MIDSCEYEIFAYKNYRELEQQLYAQLKIN